MIVKSTFRASGGIETHLLRSDTNEEVIVRQDLFRGASDLHFALRLMDGISRSNAKCLRSFIHVVISPGKTLDEAGLMVSLDAIETEFGIAADAPRAIVQHVKGARANHYHAVYSIVDLTTGRAIPSHDNFQKDEFVSRFLELRLGEPIVAGPRLAANVAEMRRRGLVEEAEILANHSNASDRDTLPRHDRQQATRLGVDPAGLSAEVFGLFESAGRDLGEFRRRLSEAGFAVARGERALLVLHDATGFETSLVRCLRREAKAGGRPLDIAERDLAEVFPNTKHKKEERDAGLARAQVKATRSVDGEWQRSLFEALADADLAALESFRAKRKKEREQDDRKDRERAQATLRARRQEIQDTYLRQDELRRLRVDRAFRMAGLFDDPRLRRLAFALATTGVLMTGGSLAMALLGAGSLVAALPTRKGARKTAAVAKRERETAKADRAHEMSRVYRDTKKTVSRDRPAARFSFEQIAKEDRILAGYYASSLIRAQNSGLSDQIDKIKDALGPELIASLDRLVERGSVLQLRRLMHWHDGIAEGRRDIVVSAALRRHRSVDHRAKTGAALRPPGEVSNVRKTTMKRKASRER